MTKVLLAVLLTVFCQYEMTAQIYDKEAILAELKQFTDNPIEYHKQKEMYLARIKQLESELLQARTVNANNAITTNSNEISTDNVEPGEISFGSKSSTKKVANMTVTNPNSYASNPSNSYSGSNNTESGTEYRVQIAVTRNSINPPVLNTQVIKVANENGSNVYYISGFTNPMEAFHFAQSLRKLDIAGAFVTKYTNGQREFSYDYLNENGTGVKTNQYNTSTSTTTNPKGSAAAYQKTLNYDAMQEKLYNGSTTTTNSSSPSSSSYNEAQNTPNVNSSTTTNPKGKAAAYQKTLDYDAMQEKLYNSGRPANSNNSYNTNTSDNSTVAPVTPSSNEAPVKRGSLTIE